jgi:sarcosine oxidase subunit beta
VDTTADVIIVGGGIVGMATAYYLAQRQHGRILVLERSFLGAGSTGSSVASIEPLAMFPSLATLQKNSIDIFKHFEEIIGGDCGFVPLNLAMFVREKEQPAMRQALKAGCAAGSKIEEMTPEAFSAHEPGMILDDIASVYYSPDAGFADPVLTLTAYADAARRLGVTIRQNTPVLGLQIEGGQIKGVETPAGIFSAPQVLLATGLWVDPLLNAIGLQSHVSFLRHYVVTLEMPPNAPHHSFLDSVFDFYMRPEKSGNLCLIGTALDNPADHFADIHDATLDPPGVTQEMAFNVWERVVKRFPMMEAAGLRKGYTGIADMTPDRQPLLGKLPIDGLYLAAGMSGIGFKMSPGVGQAMAGLLVGDAAATALLAPLRPSRVEENQLLLPEHHFSLIA